MKTADFNSRLIEGYVELLKNLDPSSKLDLISRLSKSVKSDLKHKSNTFEKAYGAWVTSEDAEEITKEIRNSRTFSRKIEDM